MSTILSPISLGRHALEQADAATTAPSSTVKSVIRFMFMAPLSHRNRLCNPDAKMQHGFKFDPHPAAVIPRVRIGGDVVHSFVIVNRRACPKLPAPARLARGSIPEAPLRPRRLLDGTRVAESRPLRPTTPTFSHLRIRRVGGEPRKRSAPVEIRSVRVTA